MSTRSARYSLFTIANKNSDSLAVRDRDAMAFIDAAELGDDLHQYAIRELVRSLKRAGLWSKMKAIYPFIGGTASAHKWNLKDPRDLDAAFRLSFSGGWTHSATGADPNGTNAYANTFLIPAADLALADHHASVYIREDTPGTSVKCEIGAIQIAPSGSFDRFLVIYAKFNNLTYMVSGDSVYPNFSNTDSRGFYLLSKAANTTLDGYRNDTKSLTAAQTSSTGGSQANVSVWLGAANQNGAPLYSDREIAFASLGQDLTDAEATNYYNIVQRYQTTLGRNV